MADLSLCGGDADWFSFNQDGDVVDARIERNETTVIGDTTIELRDSTGADALSCGYESNAENSVRLPEGAAAGTYFVRVVTNGERARSDDLDLVLTILAPSSVILMPLKCPRIITRLAMRNC